MFFILKIIKNEKLIIWNYTSFDFINNLSGEGMLLYIKILKDFANQKQIDNVMVNFNIIFLSVLLLFFLFIYYMFL